MVDSLMIKELEKKVHRMVGERRLLQTQLEEGEIREWELEMFQDDCKTVRAVIQHVAQETQKNLEFRLSSIVSSALASIWDEPYTFKVSFVKRRNKTECDLSLEKNGEECEPLDASGGGVCDVMSLSLRPTFIKLKGTMRKVLVLDEPLAFLHSPELQRRCSKMLSVLSHSLDIQIIMITDQELIMEHADTVMRVTQSRGRSKVEVIRG
jgi:hypothetical protein